MNRAMTFIFITLVIDVMGFGLIIPVLPSLVMELTGQTIAQASQTASFLTFTYAFTQLIFAPLIGNLSDRYGRRPILLASIFGFTLDYLFLALAPNIMLFFVGRAIAGITGASITTASAYIADISTEETRTKNFGLIGAAFGLGFIIGPAIGGLLGSVGLRVPFYAAAALTAFNFILGYFALPESLKEENRRPFDIKRANPFKVFQRFGDYPQLKRFFVVLFIIYLGSHAVQSNWSFFTIERFQWSEATIGFSLALAGLLVGLVQGVLIRYVNPRIGNERSIYYGIGFNILGMFLFAFAYQSWMMYAILVPYCLGGLAGPAIQSTLTGKVPANQQGEVQGLNTALVSLTSILGPLIMNNLFYTFSKNSAPVYFPGAPFLLSSVLAVLAFFVVRSQFRKWKVVE